MDTQSLRGPLGWSLASVVVICVVVLYGAIEVVSPMFQAQGDVASESQTMPLVEKYNQFVALDIARFNGRSAFFNPIRIAPPTPPKKEEPPEPEEPIVKNEEVEDPGPPPPPIDYLGPPVIAIIGDEAWFRGSGSGSDAVIRLTAGEEQNGLKLVKTTPPAMVTVEHRRGIYDIDLFDTNEPFFREDAPPVVQDGFLEEVEG